MTTTDSTTAATTAPSWETTIRAMARGGAGVVNNPDGSGGIWMETESKIGGTLVRRRFHVARDGEVCAMDLTPGDPRFT